VRTSDDHPLLFAETFATAGPHRVEIAVWNCDMTPTEAATSTLNIQVWEVRYLPIVLKKFH
jgi:hypothetical protein